MALFRNDFGKLLSMPPSGAMAGVEMTAIFQHTFAAAGGNFTAASDILEIGFLPAFCRPVRATIVAAGFGALTADVGFMTGEPGADLNQDGTARTSGDEIFDGVTVNDAENNATLATLVAIPATGVNRSIGVKISGNVTAAGQSLTLAVTYIA